MQITDRNAEKTCQAGLKPRRSWLLFFTVHKSRGSTTGVPRDAEELSRRDERKAGEKQTLERRREDLIVKRFWTYLCQPEGSVGADFTFTCVGWSRRDGGTLSVIVRERRVKTPTTGCRFDHFHTQNMHFRHIRSNQGQNIICDGEGSSFTFSFIRLKEPIMRTDIFGENVST